MGNLDRIERKNSKDFQFEIYAAIMDHKLERVKELLFYKFDVAYKMPSFMGRTVLHVAAEYGEIEIIEYLLENKAKVNCLDDSGVPPLFLAMQKGKLKAVELLLENGANMNYVTKHDLSLHHFISKSKYQESSRILSKYKYRKIKLN